MTTLLPGLYKATVRDVPDQTVMIDDTSDVMSMSPIGDSYSHADYIEDARPLIVLDPESTAVRDFLAHYGGDKAGTFALIRMAEAIEAQIKLPRIPEPGLWGVVEAHLHVDPKRQRMEYVRTSANLWLAPEGAQRLWSELVDPVLIRPGIGDPS